MELKAETSLKGFLPDINLQKVVTELALPIRFIHGLLNAALVFITNLLANILGSSVARRHFHLLLSALVLFGPVLSLWVSSYSIFANRNHYLYRKFLVSAWGWTCIFAGSFVFLISYSARRSVLFSVRSLSRIAIAGLFWWGVRRLVTLLENAAGTCYEPVTPAQNGSPVLAQPLLLLQEELTKASCLKAGMVWRGYEVSEDTLTLCLCCLLLVEEMSVFGTYLVEVEPLRGSPRAPLRILFLLCAFLLTLWVFLLFCQLAYFPQFPSQPLGGALGCLWWRGLYKGWYRLKPSWVCPGLPGDGLVIDPDTDKSQ